MLLVAPLAATPLELHLQHMQTDPKTGEVKGAVSQPYIDMTVRLMESFGVKVPREHNAFRCLEQRPFSDDRTSLPAQRSPDICDGKT